MRMFLIYDGEATAKLEAEIGPMAFIVKKAEAAAPSLLPLGVQIPMQVCGGLELKTAIARWLSNRQAREEPGGLEGGGPVAAPVMGRAYWAGSGGPGRIRQPGHAAALSYYLSGADRYYLTP